MSPTTAADALVSTVGRLWPDAGDVRLATERRSLRGAADGFLVVPNARTPRLLVPAGNPRAAAAAMRRFSAGLSVRDAVQRLGASAALRLAGPAVFPDRIVLSKQGDSLAAYLAAALGQDVDVSIGIGPARANRKPVLEVFDRHGRSLAYAKVGDSPVAERNVRGEAAALARISARLDPMLQVPTVLHTGTWQDLFVLVMSSLPTSVRQRPRDQWTLPATAMALLANAFSEQPRPLTEMPLWDRMTTTAAGLSDDGLRDDLQRALKGLAERAGDEVLPVGAWHGDWTPWNMARRTGRIQLWDWERFETGVPVGLDALHYGVNAMTRSRGSTLDAVRAGLAFSGVGADSALAGAYLAAITCRYAASAEDELGHLVSERARLMMRALEHWLDRGPVPGRSR